MSSFGLAEEIVSDVVVEIIRPYASSYIGFGEVLVRLVHGRVQFFLKLLIYLFINFSHLGNVVGVE